MISVLLPVFNVEDYIERTLLSLQNQTYSDFEVLIIDDCSTDGTRDKVLRFIDSDSRFKLYYNDENKGISYSLNKVLTKATGDYIARIDGDDIASPQRLATQLNYLLDFELDLVGCSIRTIDENDKVISLPAIFPSKKKHIDSLIKFCSPVVHIWLCKKKVYEITGNYRFDGAEDLDFILRAYELGCKISNCPDRLMDIRIRNGNTNSTIGLKQRLLHKYIFKIKDERNLNNLEASIFEYENVSFFRKKTYELSSRILRLSKKNKFIFIRLVLSFISVLISIDQFDYMIYRLKRKLILRFL
ncbi:glycosyltransferase family 2 protein [Vibrio cyclitrophicus]